MTWLSERPYDLVVVVILLGLLACTIKRIQNGISNKGIFAAHIFLAFGLTCSLYPVYTFLDPLMGGHNILNLFQRLGIGICGWLITRSLSKIFAFMRGEKRTPTCGSVGWLVAIVSGLIGSFIAMSTDESSRGLDSYSTQTIFYLLYQIFTLLGFVVGATYLIPRLRKQLKRFGSKYLRWQTTAFLVGYVSSIICPLMYILAWFSGAFVPIREVFVYLTVVAFIVAFFMAMKEKEHQFI